MAEGQYDASDEVAENNARSQQGRWRREDLDVLRKLMHDAKGRAWLYRFLDRCYIFVDPFAAEQTHATAHNLGAQNVGKALMLDAMEASTDLYVKMVKEQKEDERRQAKEMQRRNEKAEGKGEPPLTPAAQTPDLAPPAGWPGHVPPARPTA